MGGPDRLSGLGGSDKVFGGDGNDKLFGTVDGEPATMPGNDEIYGEAGEDTIIGGSGADILGGARDNDSIVDGPEDDAAFDDISSGEGNDEITSANIPASKDRVFCGGGTDVVTADNLDVVDDDCEKVSRLQNEAQVLAEDTQVYAQMEGVSEQEAARRMELEEDVGDLNAALEANEAATFGGPELADGADFGVVTYFTENGQQTVEDYVAGTPLEGTVEAQTVEASLAELETAQADAIAAYEAQSITADSDIDVTQNRVEMYVTDGDQTQSRQAAQDVAGPLPANVVSVTVDELSEPAAAFYAGFILRISNGDTYCTSGFTIRHNGGAEGALTAGHCPPHNARTFDDNRQLWHGGDIMPYVSQDRYGGQDLQWHLTPGYEDRAWFWSATGVRGVTGTRGRGHQFKDNKVCKFGQTTGVTCGRIQGKNYKPWWVGQRWGTFMRVERNGSGYMASGGDSGGPVYWRNTALGVMSGTDGRDGIYNAINFVESSDMGIRCVQKSNKTC